MNSRKHWDKVYSRTAADDLSWYQEEPRLSLDLIAASGIGVEARVIDVGGGASVLVDCLLDRGFRNVSVLDISESALEQARQRLGERAGRVQWLSHDVTTFRSAVPFDLWHDRAVLHFLTRERDRQSYVQTLDESLGAKGEVIIATFAPDGPRKCSGLRIRRYGPDAMCALLGDGFELLGTFPESHFTPTGVEQRFTYFRLRRRGRRQVCE